MQWEELRSGGGPRPRAGSLAHTPRQRGKSAPMRTRSALVLSFAVALTGCRAQTAPETPDPPAADGDAAPAPATEDATERDEDDDLRRLADRDGVRRDGPRVFDGTPEQIPADLRARLRQYLETRSASLQSLTDDGSEALIATRFAEMQQIHRVRSPGGARTQVTFSEEPARGASFAPGSTSEIVYMSDVGGDEEHQIFHLDLETGRETRITEEGTRTVAYTWNRDGTALAFASNARNGRDFDIWLSDGRDPDAAELLAEADGYWTPLEFSQAGDDLLVREYVSVTESRLYLIDVETGDVQRVTPRESPAAYPTATFSADGDRLYVATDRGGEFVQLYEHEIGTDEWVPLSADVPWNVGNLTLSSDGDTLAFTTNEGGIDVLRLLDTSTREHEAAPGIPAGVVGGLRFAREAPILGFTLSSASRTGDAYTYDPRAGELTRWTESEVGGLNPDHFVEPEIIELESFDGLEVPGLYYEPPGEGPHPVVLNIHGGPEAQARPWFSSLTQFLVNERGVAVIYPNVRGSTGYGNEYVSLDDGKKREDAVKDLGAFLDFIDERPELDPERVATYGGSYGGYMVLASLIHFGDRLRAGVNVVGISNFVTFLENTADYRRDLRRAEYGDERDPEMREFLERISPANRADEIAGELFVVHGANDPRVPASEAEQIVDAVRAEGHDVWYMLALNEGHGFARRENRDAFLELAVLFLEDNALDSR